MKIWECMYGDLSLTAIYDVRLTMQMLYYYKVMSMSVE